MIHANLRSPCFIITWIFFYLREVIIMADTFSIWLEEFSKKVEEFKKRSAQIINNSDDIYNAMDIAAYVINKSIDNNHPVSNLKLQKLLYYIQAASLVCRNKELFKDDILAWQYGPVVERVYNEYKYYSRYNILDKVNCNVEIDNESTEIIDRVLDAKANFTAYSLVDATHKEKPWIETNLGDVINKESIKEYFKDNEERIWSRKK